MISLESATFYLLLEVVGILAVGCVLLIAVSIQRARRRKTLMVDLVHRLKSTGGQRLGMLEGVIKQKPGLTDDQAHQIAQQVLAAETHFYQYLVKALLHTDDRQLIELDREVELLTDCIAKAAPIAVAAAPAEKSQVDSEQVAQLLSTVEKNHAQLLGELKKSADGIRAGLNALQTPRSAAVAATAAAVAIPEAPPPAPTPSTRPAAHDALEALPDIEDTTPSTDGNALESLPDIEDADTPMQEPANSAPDALAAAAPPVEPATDAFEQIAEMPDDLLSFSSAESSPPPATPVEMEMEIVAASPPDATENALSLDEPDTSLAPPTAAPASVAPTAEPATESPSAATMSPPPATNTTPSAGLDADEIEALLGGIGEPTASAAPTTTKPASPATPTPAATSIDEMYSNEPLIPEEETEIVAKPADNANKTPASSATTATPGNVDDLLAELDALLK